MVRNLPPFCPENRALLDRLHHVPLERVCSAPLNTVPSGSVQIPGRRQNRTRGVAPPAPAVCYSHNRVQSGTKNPGISNSRLHYRVSPSLSLHMNGSERSSPVRGVRLQVLLNLFWDNYTIMIQVIRLVCRRYSPSDPKQIISCRVNLLSLPEQLRLVDPAVVVLNHISYRLPFILMCLQATW